MSFITMAVMARKRMMKNVRSLRSPRSKQRFAETHLCRYHHWKERGRSISSELSMSKGRCDERQKIVQSCIQWDNLCKVSSEITNAILWKCAQTNVAVIIFRKKSIIERNAHTIFWIYHRSAETLRANIEATVSEYRRTMPDGKVKVRGRFKTMLFAFATGIGINFGRIFAI